MKLSISLLLIFLTAHLYCQNLKTIIPEKGDPFDFGIEVQNEWKKRNQLFEDIDNNKKDWNNLTEEDNVLFEKYPETYSSMWEVDGGGCSWYCGAGNYAVTTSSELSSNGNIDYKTKNLADFSYQTAWVEGKKGYGIGETINFSFSPVHPRVTTILFANGYIKSKKAWKDNSRVHKLKMSVNNEPYAIIELQDIYAEQIITLEKPLGNDRKLGEDVYQKYENAPNWDIKFEILSVYEGDKYDDTAITEIYFDGLDVHCLAEGTQITMADNTLKSIEDLEIGDTILSFHKETGDYEPSVIKELASKLHKDLITITFSNGTEITCTKDHPFLLNTLQWSSMSPEKTETDYEINNVVQIELGSIIKSLQSNLKIVKINEVSGTQKTYTIVDLDKNNTFIANGIVTGIEKLRASSRP